MRQLRQKSALVFVLKGLVPYTRENVMLAFKPNQFFNELEKISKYKRYTLEQAARRAEHEGLIKRTRDRQLRLTELGYRTALPFAAEILKTDSRLMIIFDIPEDQAVKRKQLRRLLKRWRFRQIQKSVWLSGYDHRESVKLAVEELELKGYVRLYECSLVYPK